MEPWILEHEPVLRLAVFVTVIALVAVVEAIRPRRVPEQPKPLRWANNLGLSVVNTVILRLMIPVTLVAAAGFSIISPFRARSRSCWPWCSWIS